MMVFQICGVAEAFFFFFFCAEFRAAEFRREEQGFSFELSQRNSLPVIKWAKTDHLSIPGGP